jgi:hypothetical protein
VHMSVILVLVVLTVNAVIRSIQMLWLTGR